MQTSLPIPKTARERAQFLEALRFNGIYDEGLEVFARDNLWILDKQKQERRLILNEAQRDYLKNRSRRDLILKARQLGFSTLIQGEFLRLAISRPVGTMTLSHEDDSTQRLRRMADFYYEKLPIGIRPRRQYSNASVSTYPDTNSEAAIGTAGGRSAGRSFTLTHLHGSEVAFWPDAETLVAGAMQAGDPSVVMESTPNGAQGWFYEQCMEALEGRSNWRLHFYPWWWTPEYQLPLEPGEVIEYNDEEAALVALHNLTPQQIKWRRAKQRELKHLFPQEYPEDPHACFLVSGRSFFGNLDGVFTAPTDAVYNPEHEYVAGLDWGQIDDFTALSIGDKTVKHQVALLRLNRLPWGTMRERIAEQLQYWNVNPLYAEQNSASSNIEELQKLFPYVETFDTINDSKTRGVNALYEAVHNHGWKLLPDPDQMHETKVFQARQNILGTWTYSAPNLQHDDTVIANMVMIYAASIPKATAGWETDD